jgi:hypothetical protein
VSDPKFHTRNITRYFRSIDPAVIGEGREWYPRARELAVELAKRRNGNVPVIPTVNSDFWDAEIELAAAVVAVLSPQVNWERNKMLAHLVYSLALEGVWNDSLTAEVAGSLWDHGLTDGPKKAFRMLVLGEDPNEVVKGPKVRQFWHTIVDPTDVRAVVVDRHAWAVAAGRVLTDAQLGKVSGRLGMYDEVSEMYRRAARILSLELERTITPAEVQAITWTAWRREHAANAKSNRRIETQEV